MQQILSQIQLHNENKTSSDALLIGISGIDAAGKGFVSKALKNKLEQQGLKVALLCIDDWHQPKTIRLKKPYGAFNFYSNAFRWNDLFDKLILPLKKDRKVDLVENIIKVHDDKYFEHHYLIENIDVILLEGIFLFKKEVQHYYDYKIWIGCDYKTALDRAKQRNQEKTGIRELVIEYENIYFPAQEIHLHKDDVLNQVNAVFMNCHKENIIIQ